MNAPPSQDTCLYFYQIYRAEVLYSEGSMIKPDRYIHDGWTCVEVQYTRFNDNVAVLEKGDQVWGVVLDNWFRYIRREKGAPFRVLAYEKVAVTALKYQLKEEPT